MTVWEVLQYGWIGLVAFTFISGKYYEHRYGCRGSYRMGLGSGACRVSHKIGDRCQRGLRVA